MVTRCRQGLVSLEQLLFVGIESGIVKDLPPGSFRNGVLGRRLLPRRLRLPRIRRGHGSRGPAVSWPDGAPGGERQRCKNRRDCGSLHDPLPFCCGDCPGCCGFAGGCATFTCCPSSSESEGLITTWSVGETPPKTSNVAP